MYPNGSYVCTFVVQRTPFTQLPAQDKQHWGKRTDSPVLYAWGVRGTSNGTNSTSTERFALLNDANIAGEANANALRLPWRGYKKEHNQE